MATYVVFIANGICSIFFSWYLVVRVMFNRIFIVYAHTKFQKFKHYLEQFCQFIFFTILCFLLLSIIPFLIHKLNNNVLNIVVDCIFIIIDFLFFLTSLLYIINPEFNFKEIEDSGINTYYENNKANLDLIGTEKSVDAEKRYISYKSQKWIKSKNIPLIKLIREDSRSFIYFVLSTIIAIICLFL